jgi:hypothetical protein
VNRRLRCAGGGFSMTEPAGIPEKVDFIHQLQIF